ncbi:hypothetical protein D2T31_08280 [Sinirhodobacter populi]|uniref:Transposase n=1 Tax=Paenirhodobacter populi TaxID=2306993 RepID=A0A443KC91_9RHOB|nr:hypothetical protein [Sinirhodobacter populi]RWR30404.1 hypothetical protein D2T31_08280 [Sinirhodobacter populi]
MPDTSNPPLQAFGFSITVTPAGRRIWPPRFKRFVLEKMDAGELTLNQITQTCGVSRSYVYQWRMQAQGKPVTATEWRAKAQFAESIAQCRHWAEFDSTSAHELGFLCARQTRVSPNLI